MIAADSGALRATSLETELARSNDELERLGIAAATELHGARRTHAAAVAKAEAQFAKVEAAEAAAALEREAYESVRSDTFRHVTHYVRNTPTHLLY